MATALRLRTSTRTVVDVPRVSGALQLRDTLRSAGDGSRRRFEQDHGDDDRVPQHQDAKCATVDPRRTDPQEPGREQPERARGQAECRATAGARGGGGRRRSQSGSGHFGTSTAARMSAVI